jgi:hypothetical protein
VFDETNGSQVEQVDIDELDDEEATCIMLRNMSIGDVCVQRNPTSPHKHYRRHSHFRRLEAAENKAFATKNKLFSVALDLFSAVSGRQKKSAENKPLFSGARWQPPKIAYFWRPGCAAENMPRLFSAASVGHRKLTISEIFFGKMQKKQQFHQQYNHNKMTETLNPELHTINT